MWYDWQPLAKKADLANYLPLTDAKTNGTFIVGPNSTLGDNIAKFYVKNSKRSVSYEVGADGQAWLWDYTNNKAIVTSKADGTNTFNGTATNANSVGGASLSDIQGWVGANYLPLSGGIVSKNGTKVMGIHNTNSVYTLFEFYGSGSELGSIGCDGVDNLVFRTVASGTKNVLHTGNSAKVAIQSTAPTDTSALWVW